MTTALRNPKDSGFVRPPKILVDGLVYIFLFDEPVVKGGDLGPHASVYYSPYTGDVVFRDANTGAAVEIHGKRRGEIGDRADERYEELCAALRPTMDDVEDARFHAERDEGIGRAVDVFKENGIDGKGWWEK